jgi:2-polyprenyl-3-methyl-5-hydroxy-6-metoxy-1,4-benzoquinol methylase
VDNEEYCSSNYQKYQDKRLLTDKILGGFSERIVSLVEEVDHSKVLSLGCGEGFGIKKSLIDHDVSFQECIGIDINIDALLVAGRVLDDERVRLVAGDIYNIPIKIQSFDLIFCLEVFEHLVNPEIPLRKIAESFKGHCIFSVPHEPVYRIMRMAILHKNILQLGNHPEHLHNWSRRQFESFVRKYFVIDRVVMPFPWTIVLCHGKKGI